MNLEKLFSHIQELNKRYPSLRGKFNDLFELCVGEIEDGGSESHEVELCLTDINDLITEHERKGKV